MQSGLSFVMTFIVISMKLPFQKNNLRRQTMRCAKSGAAECTLQSCTLYDGEYMWTHGGIHQKVFQRQDRRSHDTSLSYTRPQITADLSHS